MFFCFSDFIKSIKKEDLIKLGDLIMTDQTEESLDLSCELINNYMSYIPIAHCKNYGEYILYMIKYSVKEYFEKNRS